MNLYGVQPDGRSSAGVFDVEAGTRLAVVAGASIAGLLAATALSEQFDTVLVLDRDDLPDGPLPRRGVPQGRHPHAVLSRGVTAFEQLLPGLIDSVMATGAHLGDLQDDTRWYVDGLPIAAGRSGLPGLAVSRPLLEYQVRRRVAALPGVRIVGRSTITGLLADPASRRVTGVTVFHDNVEREITGVDLVVDGTGRASRAGAWLDELGCGRVRTEQSDVGVVYVSRRYRKVGNLPDRLLGVVSSAYPGLLRGGLVVEQENDVTLVGLSAWCGEVPPTDDDGMLAWARTLNANEIAESMLRCRPLGSPALMRFPGQRRHHFADMSALPEGFVPLGDAICSFNPVYAQGMTVVALQALLLRDLLREPASFSAARFLHACDVIIDVPWRLSSGNDLRIQRAAQGLSPASDPASEYLRMLRRAVTHDPAVGTAYLRVTNLLDPPSALSDPVIAARVAAAVRTREAAMPN